MFIDNVNLNHIRVFECVYRTRSMTQAARELHLTQSGVSQHIKSLEEMLGIRLFDRLQQKLVATSAASLLFKRSSQSLQDIEKALWEIKGVGHQLSGTVTIGMPTEFGNNLVIPLLAQTSRKHPLIHFKVKLGLAAEMNELLLSGEVDFAFVDGFRMDRRVKTERVYDEILELCASEDLIRRKGPPKNTRQFFESLEYVDYQDEESIVRLWFTHHFSFKHLDINVRVTAMDVQSLARLIVCEVGAGILPSHRIAKLEQQGQRIYRFKGSGKPMKNTISVAYLNERSHTPSTLATLEALKEGLIR